MAPLRIFVTAITFVRLVVGLQFKENETQPLNLAKIKSKIKRGLPEDIDSWGQGFRKQWEELRQSTDTTSWQQNSSGVKALLGIPSCPADDVVRHIIQESWGQQPGVCFFSEQSVKDDNCKVILQFVVGRGRDYATPGVKGNTYDLAVTDGFRSYKVDGQDKRDYGSFTRKVFEYLKHSSREFSWATHIGMVDQDWLPHIHKMIPAIAALGVSSNKFQYLGRRIADNYFRCYFSMKDIESHNAKDDGAYCTFGMFWFLSNKLAEGVTGPDYKDYFLETVDHPELADRDLGRAISRFAAHGNHVETFPDDVGDSILPGA